MVKPNWNFRPTEEAQKQIEAYMSIHKIEERTRAILLMLEERTALIAEKESLTKDRDAWKNAAEKLQADKPVYCKVFDIDLSKQACYNCAVTKKRELCNVGFEVRANHLSVSEAFEKVARMQQVRAQKESVTVPPNGPASVGGNY